MDLMHIHRQPSRLYILILNFVTLLASLVLFAAGIQELAGGQSQLPLHSDAISWALIALGLVVFLVSVLGGISALSLSKRIAYIYGTLLLILVLLQLIFLIYAMIRHDHVDSMMDNAWQKAYDTNERALLDLETRFHCCGFEKVTDRAVPKTYKKACINSPAFGYNVSCKQQLQNVFYDHERLTIAAITGVVALQLLALGTIVLMKRHLSDDTIEDRYSTGHSQRLLRGLRSEDEGRSGYGDQSGSAETRGDYGSTLGQ